MLRKIVSAPKAEPVTLEDVYAHTNSDSDDETYLSTLIPAARKRFETMTGRLLVEQTWQLALPKFTTDICLPLTPLRSITSIKYINGLGQLVTIDPSEYRVVSHGLTAVITPRLGGSWPAVGYKVSDAVQIECVFGHAGIAADQIDAASISDEDNYKLAKQSILILIADWFRNREDTAPVQLYETPNAFKAICSELSVQLL